MAPTIVFLTNTALTTWTVPSDWNNATNIVECIGGGGGGTDGGGNVGTGGEGGHYARSKNLTLTPGATVNIAIGAGGAGIPGQTAASSARRYTWFGGTNLATSLCGAVGGAGASLGGGPTPRRRRPTMAAMSSSTRAALGRGWDGGGNSAGANAGGGAAGPGGPGGGGGGAPGGGQAAAGAAVRAIPAALGALG